MNVKLKNACGCASLNAMNASKSAKYNYQLAQEYIEIAIKLKRMKKRVKYEYKEYKFTRRLKLAELKKASRKKGIKNISKYLNYKNELECYYEMNRIKYLRYRGRKKYKIRKGKFLKLKISRIR